MTFDLQLDLNLGLDLEITLDDPPPKSTPRSVRECSQGDIIEVSGYGSLELLKLTPSRALVRPAARVQRTLTTKYGVTRTFTAPMSAFSISLGTVTKGTSND